MPARNTTVRMVALASGADTLLCGKSLHRVRLRINPTVTAAGAVVVTFVAPFVMTAAGQGMPLAATSAFPETVTREEHGALVQQDWHAWAIAANGLMNVLETEELDGA